MQRYQDTPEYRRGYLSGSIDFQLGQRKLPPIVGRLDLFQQGYHDGQVAEQLGLSTSYAM